MADTVIAAEIQLDGTNALRTVGDLRNQIVQLQSATAAAGEQSNTMFQTQFAGQAGDAQKQVAALNISMGDLGHTLGALEPLLNFGNVLSSGLTAATQSAALFTQSGTEAGKKIQQLESTMMLQAGLKGLGAGILQFKRLGAIIPALQLSFKGLGGALFNANVSAKNLASNLNTSGTTALKSINQSMDAESKLDKVRQGYDKNESGRVKRGLDDWQSAEDKKLTITRQLSNGVMALSNTVFDMELERAGKNQKQRENILKKQFEVNKTFQMADATINYLKGLVSIPASTPQPFATAEQVALTATYVASLSKIASSQFSSNAAALTSLGSSAAAGVNISSVNSTMLRNQQQQTQTMSSNNQNLKVYVTESDISAAQLKVNKIKANATFK